MSCNYNCTKSDNRRIPVDLIEIVDLDFRILCNFFCTRKTFSAHAQDMTLHPLGPVAQLHKLDLFLFFGCTKFG